MQRIGLQPRHCPAPAGSSSGTRHGQVPGTAHRHRSAPHTVPAHLCRWGAPGRAGQGRGSPRHPGRGRRGAGRGGRAVRPRRAWERSGAGRAAALCPAHTHTETGSAAGREPATWPGRRRGCPAPRCPASAQGPGAAAGPAPPPEPPPVPPPPPPGSGPGPGPGPGRRRAPPGR